MDLRVDVEMSDSSRQSEVSTSEAEEMHLEHGVKKRDPVAGPRHLAAGS